MSKRSFGQYIKGQPRRRAPGQRKKRQRRMPSLKYSQMSGELKFHDFDFNVATFAGAGVVEDSIIHIAQGVTDQTRVGRKCRIKKIMWRWQAFLPEQDGIGAPPDNDTCRLIVFQDRQCNGAAATVTNILTTASFQSFRNLTNTGRFKILYDETVDLNYNATNGGGADQDTIGYQISGTMFKDCDIPIEYSGATGAIGEITSNNIGVMTISSNGTGGLNSKFRIRFSDQ